MKRPTRLVAVTLGLLLFAAAGVALASQTPRGAQYDTPTDVTATTVVTTTTVETETTPVDGTTAGPVGGGGVTPQGAGGVLSEEVGVVGAAGGVLPFTGFQIALALVASALLTAAGLGIRRLSRRKEG